MSSGSRSTSKSYAPLSLQWLSQPSALCHASHMALLIAALFISLAVVSPAPAKAASACGGQGQRGCCVLSSERLSTGACYSGYTEVSGCSGDCLCGGSGVAVFFGASSSSHCEAVTACGGPGERACCITETRWDNNPIPASGGCRYDSATSGINGLTEIAGGSGQGQLCGGSNPLGIRSNGTCTQCGTEGAHACVGVAAANECGAELTKDVLGFCTSCGREGQPICDITSPSPTCAPGFHPDTGVCRADRTVAEPDCNCNISSRTPNPVTQPVRGYADLHLHMFSNLAFGGLTVWGDAFNPWGGVSQALRADNYAMRTADRIINGHVVTGINSAPVPVDLFRKQTVVHGDLHINDLIGYGTNQRMYKDIFSLPLTPILPNGGVEWDSALNINGTYADFIGWPKWSSTTHQQSYYKWLERAHKGGLQLIVMFGVNNETLCASNRRFDSAEFQCDDTMSGINLQLAKAREFEQWLNTQCVAGVASACALNASNQGWFKIVESPAAARKAIANGQLAVVLGIEEAALFGCKKGMCTAESVRAQLEAYHNLGVRHIFPVHNFDNAFGGAATWMDTIAVANRYATGSYYAAENCPATSALDGTSGYGFKLFNEANTDIFAEGFLALQQATLGLDPLEPGRFLSFYLNTTCNRDGLTNLGEFLVREMMSKKMIIDVDHMSIKSFDRTLALAEAKSYPGVVASHALMFELTAKATRHERMRTRADLQRIARLGGMVAVMTQPPAGNIVQPGPNDPGYSAVINDCAGSTKTWAQAYRYAVDVMTIKGVQPGVAFGTDFNGISQHNGPRFGVEGCTGQDDATKVQYPFTITGFGSFDKQVTSSRVFDYNTDGLAHIGLLPDMVEDMKKTLLTDDQLDPLFQSAEAYIRMWEAAEKTAVPAVSLNDTVPPVTTASVAPPGAESVWRNQDVTVTLTAVDFGNAGVEPSGVTEIIHGLAGARRPIVTTGSTATRTITTDGISSINYSARDLAGNQETTKTLSVRLDKTPPSVAMTGLTPANANNWNNTDVVAGFSCADTLSGIAGCSAMVTLTTEGSGQSITGTASDNAGNTNSAVVSPINIDKTPPTIATNGRTPANANNWNNTDVIAGFTCADTLSGIAGCTATVTLTTQGSGQSITGTASDNAGNTNSAVVSPVNIDKTPPVAAVTGVADGQVYVRGAVPAAACSTVDQPGLSGVATPATLSITGGNAHGVGSYTATCSGAVDLAGNVSIPARVTYYVHYDFSGFFAPVDNQPTLNVVNAGSNIPVKFGLSGNFGTDIFRSGGPGTVSVPCTTLALSDIIDETLTSTTSGLSYDSSGNQYNYRWKTDRAFAGACRRFNLNLDDGSEHFFLIKFK